jgi:hypothetical protein
MIYGLEMCSSFAAVQTTGGNSICRPTYVFVFSTTEKAFPLRAPLPIADTVVGVVGLPLAHLSAHVLPNNRLSYPTSPSINTERLKYARL